MKKFIKQHKIQLTLLVCIIILFICFLYVQHIMGPSMFQIVYLDGRDKPLMERSCEQLQYWLDEGWLSRSLNDQYEESTVIKIMTKKECFKKY